MPKNPKFKITFIPVQGDPVAVAANALWPGTSRTLNKHGAQLQGGKLTFDEIVRKHARL